MASQTLHDLLDDLENAIAPARGMVSSAETRIAAAFKALRDHADNVGEQLLTDAESAGHTLEGQVAADAAPLVTDIESGVTDLVHTAEQAAAGAPDEAPPAADSDPSVPAEPQPAA